MDLFATTLTTWFKSCTVMVRDESQTKDQNSVSGSEKGPKSAAVMAVDEGLT